MKIRGVPALFLTLGLIVIYLAAFGAQAGAFQYLPANDELPTRPPDPTPSSGPAEPISGGETIASSESGAESAAWTPLPVADDPLLRLPGTQPDQGVHVLRAKL